MCNAISLRCSITQLFYSVVCKSACTAVLRKSFFVLVDRPTKRRINTGLKNQLANLGHRGNILWMKWIKSYFLENSNPPPPHTHTPFFRVGVCLERWSQCPVYFLSHSAKWSKYEADENLVQIITCANACIMRTNWSLSTYVSWREIYILDSALI